MKTCHVKLLAKILMILAFPMLFQNVNAYAFTRSSGAVIRIANSSANTDTVKHVSKSKEKDLDMDADNPGVNKVLDRNKKHPQDGVDNNIIQRNKQEFLRIKDPTTNGVPVERLIRAKAIKDQMMAHPAANIGGINSSAPLSSIGWTERGPNNVGGRTRALMYDLGDAANGYKKVFAGGVDGGLWYTTDITAATIVWNRINDFFENIAISCIAQNPVNPKEIYAGTGEGFYNGDAVQGLGVWKSSDGGATWNRLASTAFYTGINSILVDKNGSVYLAAQNFGILKSGDGGSSWSNVISSSSGADLQLASNGDVYAATGVFSTGSIFISDFAANGVNTGNAGTWTNITPNPSGTITPSSTDWWRIKLASAPNNSNIVYALFEGSGTYSLTSVQQYNKANNTWAVKVVPPGSPFGNGQAWYSIAAAVDPNNANVLYAGSLDGAMSADGGSTWTTETQWYVGEVSGLKDNQYVHADHHAYVYAPGSSTNFLIGCDGGIFYTSTANATNPGFEDRNHSYNVTQFYAVALHPTNNNYALAGAQDNGTQQFTTAGMNATNEVTGGDGAGSFIDQTNGNIQITSYVYNNHWVSTDNGVTFNQQFFNYNGSFINPSDYDPNTKDLYSGDISGSYFRWDNVTTANTTDVSVSGFNGANITSVNMSPITHNRVYFGLSNGTVVRVDSANTGTSNTGKILSPNPSLTFISVSCVAIDPNNEDHLLVSYYNYGIVSIFETKNANAATPTWTQVEGNLPDMPVRWVMFYPGDVTKALIATELGVWTTEALNGASTTWTASNSGLANVEVDMLTYRPSDRTLAAATHGRGLFTTTLPAPISTNASLANLTISSGTLSPAFATATTSYAVSVASSVTSVLVRPTASDATATIKVNGTTVASGTVSGNIPLAVGANTISTVVTAQDGVSTKTYTITVTRAAPLSTIATLSNFTISSGTLSPAFATATTSYAVSVANSVTSVLVRPTATDATATIKVNGTTVASGAVSGSIPLVVGANTINAVVTAQDGTTTKTYTITVTRAASAIATLSNFTISSGTLTPAFATNTTGYSVSVASSVTSVLVRPTTTDSAATIKVNGTTVASGTVSGSIPLTVGANTISTVVTAQDGVTTKTYTITVTRAAPLSTIATLSNFTISSGTLSPAFATATTSYSVSVANSVTSVLVRPTATSATATIKVNGTTVASGTVSGSIPLAVGANTINAVVTAQDGVTTKTYAITVTRAAPLSTIATLSNFTISSGTLSPAFATATTSYSVSVANSVTSVLVRPTASSATATIKVNGTTVASGTVSGSIPLAVGANTINAVVTAQDGVTTKTYTLTVTRAISGLNSFYLPGSGQQTSIVSFLNEKVEANNILSPNGDGINDIWVVKNIAFYPNNRVTVYDKAGAIVFTKKGYANDWGGTYRGSVLNEGTYYYLVELGNGSTVKGFISVMRER